MSGRAARGALAATKTMGVSLPRIGFLGAGKMATALARGWIQAGLCSPERLCASDPLPQARTEFSKTTGANSSSELINGHARRRGQLDDDV